MNYKTHFWDAATGKVYDFRKLAEVSASEKGFDNDPRASVREAKITVGTDTGETRAFKLSEKAPVGARGLLWRMGLYGVHDSFPVIFTDYKATGEFERLTFKTSGCFRWPVKDPMGVSAEPFVECDIKSDGISAEEARKIANGVIDKNVFRKTISSIEGGILEAAKKGMTSNSFNIPLKNPLYAPAILGELRNRGFTVSSLRSPEDLKLDISWSSP